MLNSPAPRACARPRVALVVAAVAACLTPGAPARADHGDHGGDGGDDHAPRGAPEIETVALFDAAKLESPENLAMDSEGNLYVSLVLTGEIRKLTPHGTQSAFARLPLGGPPLTTCGPFVGGVTGLAFDHHDVLYAGLASCDPASRGVWRVARDGGATLLANLPAAGLPNGLAYRGGALYVADSSLGRVWRVSATAPGPAEIWSSDPLLARSDAASPGPNGAQFFHDELYVSNSDTQEILAIPIAPDGSAGAARLHASGVWCDDFAFDAHGALYCGTDPFGDLVRVAPDGSSAVLLTTADGLDGPTSAMFGRLGDDRRNLYVTNAAFPFFSTTHRPSLLRVELDVAGVARP
jgi:sugar lactone lactonase YvrE